MGEDEMLPMRPAYQANRHTLQSGFERMCGFLTSMR